MNLEVSRQKDNSVIISSRDSSWVVEPDPDWGIKIVCLGCSKIPVCPDILDRPDVYKRQRAENGIGEPKSQPVPLLLDCPDCGTRHVDEGEFATKEHHTHACQFCGMVWRPAIVPTVGVRFLPGFGPSGT